MSAPLADRIRPKKLPEFIGQEHLMGKDKPIRLAIETKQVFSMIFWGPPGCGKTTLAQLIAKETDSKFFFLSAVSSGKSDVRKIVESAKKSRQGLFEDKEEKTGNTVLFLDEIHRFNKAQQDYLLPYVENGTITLIGATTENPSFEVISPLLSRCRVFILTPLSPDEMLTVINRALVKLSSKNKKKIMDQEAKDWLIGMANGDARQAISLIEDTDRLYGELTIKTLKEALQSKHLRFDKKGEEHYNTISAFIKSMRASNVDAALYYLARMVDAGEDPLFIARRMVIFASEDIGMAQPTALVVANEVFRACETIGYPECQINLAHGAVYLAKAPKDRSACDSYFDALSDVKEYGNLSIPLHLRNPVTKLMKKIGYGKDYEKYPDKNKNLLPDELKGKKYYQSKQKSTF